MRSGSRCGVAATGRQLKAGRAVAGAAGLEGATECGARGSHEGVALAQDPQIGESNLRRAAPLCGRAADGPTATR